MKRQSREKNRYIIWIDHKKAMLGKFNRDGEFSHMIFRSEIESRLRYKGEETNKSRIADYTINRQPHLQRKFNQELAEFCARIAGLPDNISTVYIMGPADAKHILKNELEKKFGVNGITIIVRPADKMTVIALKEAGEKYYKIPASPERRIGKLKGSGLNSQTA